MMKMTARMLGPLIATTMLAVLVLATPGQAGAANSANATANSSNSKATTGLDARLGGTKKSFAAVFGTATKTQGSGDIESYTVSGFGLVAAAFLSSKAYEVTIAADRLSHKPLTDADPADWTVANAARFADAVVPTDSTYAAPVKSKTKIEIVGHSVALEKAFTQKNYDKLQVAGKPGDFDVIYNLDTAGKVFSVDVSLGNGGTVATAGASSTKTSNSTSTSNSTTAGNSAPAGQVVHCRDFQTHADAQAYFDAHGGDSNPAVSGMDGDKDGKACENLP